MRKNRKVRLKEEKVNLILVFVILVIMSINIIILINSLSSTKKTSTVNNTIISKDETSQVEDKKTISEQSRIQKYWLDFIKHIDNEEFSKAYEVLNSEYKKKYFPTINEFEKYARERIGTGELTINFTNIERLGNEKTGNIYILWANICDITKRNIKTNEEEYMNIVILEHDDNNYELSFSIE